MIKKCWTFKDNILKINTTRFNNNVMQGIKLLQYNRAINTAIMCAKNNTFCKPENSIIGAYLNP